MANTTIQLKYSTITGKPAALAVGEPAYSYSSNTFFIGTPDGAGSLNIGGYFYTSTIDSATNSATGGTLVKRDATGNASFNYIFANIVGTITGTASSADKLTNARNFEINGLDVESAAVAFDGTAGVVLQGNLKTTGVSSGTYGGATQIPYFTVDSKGRISAAGNTAISTNLNIAADTGTNVISLATDTLTFVGGDGITTTVGSTDNVSFAVDNTVIRTTGDQTITGNLSLVGVLSLTGNTALINVTNYQVNDTIIYLGANNYTSDILDTGFASNYYDGSTQRHAGVIRKAGTNDFYLFTNYDEEFDSNTLNIANPSLTIANTHTNVKDGTLYNVTVDSLATDLAVKDGGTGTGSFTTGAILIGNGTGALQTLANTLSAGTYADGANIPVITIDNYGRVSSVSNTPVSIGASQITSGTLAIARGGTNQTTFTQGQRVIFDGTSLASQANTTTTGTGTLTAANTITSLTFNSYGEVTAYTSQAIAISADQITSGTLAVNRGGTGAGTFTVNGVLLGNGTSAFNTASSSTEGHVLTINASGVPTFSMISGGTF